MVSTLHCSTENPVAIRVNTFTLVEGSFVKHSLQKTFVSDKS